MNEPIESKKKPGNDIGLNKTATLLDHRRKTDDDTSCIWLETDAVSADFMNDREQPEDQQR